MRSNAVAVSNAKRFSPQTRIANGMAEEIEAPADEPAGERWFRHIPTGSVWHLLSDENPNGPGFWPAHENDKAA